MSAKRVSETNTEREVSSEDTEKEKRGGKVSLNPLSFEEALAGLIQVEPPESKAKSSREKTAKKAKKRVTDE